MKKLSLTYSLELLIDEDDPHASMGVRVVGLDGCFSQGSTVDEAISNAHEAIEGWLKVAREQGVQIPAPPKRPEVTIHRYRSEWLTVGDVAKAIGVSPATVRKIIVEGDLPGYRFSKELRIRQIDLALYVAAARTRRKAA